MRNTVRVDDNKEIVELVEMLRNRDPNQRKAARQRLVHLGTAATGELVRGLKSPDHHVRWEVVKALTGIADEGAIPALIEAMDDDNVDVRWVAGDAMIAIGKQAIKPLLTALVQRADSSDFCSSAHHVLREWVRREPAPSLKLVLEALQHSNPAVMVPPVAQAAAENI